MLINFKKADWSDYGRIKPFYSLRSDFSCDSSVIDTFLWSEYYNTEYAIIDNEALVFKMSDENGYFTWMPRCKKEDLPKYIKILKKYFNENLASNLRIELSDSESLEYSGIKSNPDFSIHETSDLRDYIYLKDDLVKLEGKKFQQKRNHINKFIRTYENNWEYRSLSKKDFPEIKAFLNTWHMGSLGSTYADKMIDYEAKGLRELLDFGDFENMRIGGIYVFGELKAFSIGSLNERNNMVVINIEKADSNIDGIYQIINKYFLINEFPDVKYVNREDDMGLPGLRKAKESYNPHMYCQKYTIAEKGIICQ